VRRMLTAQAKPTDISGAVFDGQALDYAGVMKLEKMPTKLELIATVARLIKQVRCRAQGALILSSHLLVCCTFRVPSWQPGMAGPQFAGV
jgi:hypothetical protein